jgi:hypothetical protein
MMQVEKGIPIPEPQFAEDFEAKYNKYPFLKMEVGDSVYFEDYDMRIKVQGYLSKLKKRKGMVFTCRVEDIGFRVWRVE